MAVTYPSLIKIYTLQAAETGSGKTGAFALPTLQIVYETLREQLIGRGKKI
jgi:superfamily II DNA/RNA helicase